MTNPAVSIVVLTCNREDVLNALLARLLEQTIASRCEIIVVDNGSTAATADVLARYPAVVSIRLATNQGSCAGRNVGIRAATAPIVLTIDDDVFPVRSDEIQRVLAALDSAPECHAMTFKVVFPRTGELVPFNWFHPRHPAVASDTQFETDYIAEGATAFRTAIIEEVGGYPEEFFMSHEGFDLAYRLIDHGYRIDYRGDIRFEHHCAPQQRTTWRNTYFDTRNYLWLLVRHLPVRQLVVAVPYRCATTFLFALSRWQLGWYFRAIWDAIWGLPHQIAQRHVIRPATQARLRSIRRHKPGAWCRLSGRWTRLREFNRHF